MVPESLARMSLRPLTTGLSAGSSVALALKLFEWADSAHFQPLLAGSSSSSRFIEPWSFILGLLTGLIIYATIEWALTVTNIEVVLGSVGRPSGESQASA